MLGSSFQNRAIVHRRLENAKGAGLAKSTTDGFRKPLSAKITGNFPA